MRLTVPGPVAVLLTAIILMSCKNKYEEQLIGVYLLDSAQPDSAMDAGSVVLTLDQNGGYVLVAHGTYTQGTWEAGDNGDWTWIDFHGAKEAQARVLGEHLETIEVMHPAILCCPEATKLLLTRR